MQTLFIADWRKEFKPLIEKYLNINAKTLENDGTVYDVNIEQFHKNAILTAMIIRDDVLIVFEKKHANMITKDTFSLKPGENFDEFMSNCSDKVIYIGFKAIKL